MNATNPTDHPIAYASTFLFVPGNRPERFTKALSSGAHAIIIDLEDAVAEEDKAAARSAIRQAWPGFSAEAAPAHRDSLERPRHTLLR
jgi:citrate lyase subunit beta / citryl-CoA lyase